MARGSRTADLLGEVRAVLETHRDARRAAGAAAYLRDQFVFFGLTTPRFREVSRPLFQALKPLMWAETAALAQACYAQPEREFHHFGLELLWAQRKTWRADSIDLFESLILQHSWWDTVDYLAPTLTGHWFRQWGDPGGRMVQWNAAENLWLIRSSLIYQLKFKDQTDFGRLQAFIEPHRFHPDFFVRKAIGWALRQYSYVNPEGVRRYVEQTDLHPLSRREALKALLRTGR